MSEGSLPVDLIVGRVHLHIDRHDEDYWVLVHADYDPRGLWYIMDWIDAMGLEVMTEEECPSEVGADGSVKSWLADKEVSA